jgi:putative MATE family efflux protein
MEESELTKGETKSEIKQGAVDLTVGSPAKGIIKFSIPLVLGNVFQLFYSWTDAIMLGNIKGSPEMFSALSGALPAVNLLLTFVYGFLVGAIVVLGHMFGRGDYAELKKGYATIMIAVTTMSLFIGIVGILLAEPILKLINIDPLYLPNSVLYLRYYFGGLIFMALYNAFSQTLRCLGNSKVPLVALIICVLLNIALDYVFVMFLDMGVDGVAIATIIAQFVSAVIMFIYIQVKVPLLRLGKGDLRFNTKIMRRMISLGVPSMIQNLCASIGFMVINGIVNGTEREFTTAFGLGNRIDEILSQINNSFSVAITSYSAQNKGKGDIDRIKKGYRATMTMMAVTMLTLAALIYIFRAQLLSLFVDMDSTNTEINMPRVLEIANIFLSIYLPSFIILSTMTTTSGLIRGTGAAKLAMTVNLFSLAVRVVAALILAQVSPYGVFYASPIGWLAGAVWAVVIYFKGNWAK